MGVNSIKVPLVLPAFSDTKNMGHVFMFELHYKRNIHNVFYAECDLGSTIMQEMKRVTSILYRLNPIWEMLKGDFTLYGSYQSYKAMDIASAGLGIAIALYNLARKLNGSIAVTNLVGTGLIRIDGLVEYVDGIESKAKAVFKHYGLYNKLVTAREIPHLLEIDRKLTRFV